MRDVRRHFENLLGQMIDAVQETASAGDENTFADVIDERFFVEPALEQLKSFAQPQMNDRVQRLALDLFAGETGIVLQQNRFAREAIAEYTLPSSIFSFSARAIGMRSPIEISLVM